MPWCELAALEQGAGCQDVDGLAGPRSRQAASVAHLSDSDRVAVVETVK